MVHQRARGCCLLAVVRDVRLPYRVSGRSCAVRIVYKEPGKCALGIAHLDSWITLSMTDEAIAGANGG